MSSGGIGPNLILTLCLMPFLAPLFRAVLFKNIYKVECAQKSGGVQRHKTQCQDEVRTYSAGTHILKVVKWG